MLRVLLGVALIVAGIAQFLLRDRIARSRSAANREFFGGRFGGPRMTAFSSATGVVSAVVFVVVGVLVAVGVLASG